MKKRNRISKKRPERIFYIYLAFQNTLCFFPSTKTDKALGIWVKTILLQFVHKIVNKKKTTKKTGKMSGAKYILFFILHILCKFCSNRSTKKKFPKNWVGPLNFVYIKIVNSHNFIYNFTIMNAKFWKVVFVSSMILVASISLSHKIPASSYFIIRYNCCLIIIIIIIIIICRIITVTSLLDKAVVL